MGHTGAGKSTILKILLRYYEPNRGRILINGIDIQNLTLESVRNHLGFVSQDPFLFYGTIRDNVVYARSASDEELQNALDLAGASEFVSQMENTVDTMVGDRGVKLSGGQNARISLARALLKTPSLLILDEASSALDAETEKRIQANLLKQVVREQRLPSPIAFRPSEMRMKFFPWLMGQLLSEVPILHLWRMTVFMPVNGRFKLANLKRSKHV